MAKIDINVEQSLYERIRKGDKVACNECVEMHYDSLLRLALRIVSERMEAEDIVQEAFMRAFTSIHDFDGRSRLGTWLFRITYNTALMHLRKTKPLSVSVDDSLAEEGEKVPEQLFDWCCLPENDFLRSEALVQVGEAVESLPESLREVFIMREYEGASTNDVAESLNLSEGAVKVRLHRARQALREHLEDYFGEIIQ